jgi:hypothetical protein
MSYNRCQRLRATRDWWEGEPDLDFSDDYSTGREVRRWHWTTRMVRAVLAYVRENHRWLIGTAVAIAGLVMAARHYGLH